MILYIVRHAWAADRDDLVYPDDGQRPLTREGRKRFAKLVKKLSPRGLAPQAIVTSPLVRCRETAELLAAGSPGKPELIQRTELEPGSDLDGLLRWTNAELGTCQEVAWVGHAPDVGQMAGLLLGAGEAAVDFSKGAIAAIAFDDRPALGQGLLRWLVTAKVLGV
jgi:phosphohistidine phosphatase